MNTQKTVIFLQKPLYSSFIQHLIKFSQMNLLRVDNRILKVAYRFQFILM